MTARRVATALAAVSGLDLLIVVITGSGSILGPSPVGGAGFL